MLVDHTSRTKCIYHALNICKEVIELHDKFTAYLNGCFANVAIKKAFEIFLNKGVAGSLSPEALASFCDNVLEKDNEKLTDDAMSH
ncbi:hypothetical protein V2J09_017880 [Rumex salicifolius]